MILEQQAEKFMHEIQVRRRDPVKQATVKAYRSHLDKWILPLLGNKDLSQIENGVAKNFVQKLSEAELSSASINSIFNTVKQIVKSAVDENGNRLHERTWNTVFIDLPAVKPADQKTPCLSPKTLQRALGRAQSQDKALYALLAGSGLRKGEAFALMIGLDNGKDSYWVPEEALIKVRSTMIDGKIQLSPKTEAGIREVDLHPDLNAFLKENLLMSNGLLFKSQLGGPIRINTAYEHLEVAGITEGFHAFRRFRITHLESVGCPPGLQRLWTGHAANDVHEKYIKMGENLEVRKTWAQRAGLGFSLETQ